ncbi:exported hypothetical protein [[Clostridium] ultunense Esp]|uniref:Bypass of forespore C C-terminal domain-containing protein n=1 Tax=[Clostridium] ultunense Esp TaxID=1288971 RepID=M1Z8V2_9FIRM|nr:BofC C-terminal domain-containing protein [Schnuerera ultunensis]CCQ94018.1 exported hypothetical protein [[Clostridium] ultunense Esp]SHD76882.1 conserved protein of unknown function [[Clostridium] ultunense Esp]
MKKQNAILIFLFCATLFFISFVYGYKMMGRKANENPKIAKENLKDYDLDLAILKEEERISPNVFIEKKTYYKACNHNITKLNELDEKIINMTEKEYRRYTEENFPNVKIISFSVNRIILREERDHLCPNHYIIGQSEGKIAIYRIDENGDEILDRVFKDYPISLLKQIDQDKLIKGIRVDSEEELSDVLENFIS